VAEILDSLRHRFVIEVSSVDRSPVPHLRRR
jgi:hypothetical protein